jgi:hypothetical protein
MMAGGKKSDRPRISDTAGLRSELESRAAAVHTHVIGDVTGLAAAIAAKQDTLVSATNIKTINGSSIVGAGDLVVGGGGGGPHAADHENGGADEIDVTGLSGLLADAQTPLAHTHPQTDVVGLVAALNDLDAAILDVSAQIDAHVDNWGEIGGVLADQVDLQAALDAKAAVGHNHAGVYEPANANIQAHIASAHAPANAQKNSDITKAEIEAVLTGVIASHSHAGSGADPSYAPGSITVLTGTFRFFADRIELTGVQELAIEGDATVVVI